MVDKVGESAKFAFGVKQMKTTCVAASVENDKQVIRE